ncbi:hypothetical protein B0H14DRAFT_3445522 [Mycena olivaceomarginata]|nr:hypothetical protein B0H14DRAFT_3445522 [Mycena olivaceomarginata]
MSQKCHLCHHVPLLLDVLLVQDIVKKKKEELAEKPRIKMKEGSRMTQFMPKSAKNSASEEPDAAETDADTNPEPAAGKKRKWQEEDKGKVQEGGSGKKSAGGKKAKQAEGKGKEKEKTKEKKQKGKEDSGGKKRKRGSAEFVATDDDEPEGTTAGGNAVAGGSSGVAGGGTGGNAVVGGSTGPGTSSWDCMQEKRAKDLKAAAEAKQRMEVDIAADIVSGKIKPKAKKKCQPKSAKEIDEDNYNNEDSS